MSKSKEKPKTVFEKEEEVRKRERLDPHVTGDIKWVTISITNPDSRRTIQFTNTGIRLSNSEEIVDGSDYTKSLFRKVWKAVQEEE